MIFRLVGLKPWATTKRVDPWEKFGSGRWNLSSVICSLRAGYGVRSFCAKSGGGAELNLLAFNVSPSATTRGRVQDLALLRNYRGDEGPASRPESLRKVRSTDLIARGSRGNPANPKEQHAAPELQRFPSRPDGESTEKPASAEIFPPSARDRPR
jgi:hypothetical protein